MAYREIWLTPTVKLREKPRYVYKSTLSTQYGLNQTWINLLGDSDLEIKNPHARRETSFLYARERVEFLIDARWNLYQHLISLRASRSVYRNPESGIKREKTMADAETAPLEIYPLPRSHEDMVNLLENHYGRLVERSYALSGWVKALSVNNDTIVSYLRHYWTNYEDVMQSFAIRLGAPEAFCILRSRIDPLIKKQMETLK